MNRSRKPSRSRWESIVNSRRMMFATSSVWVAFIFVVLVSRWGATTPVEPELQTPLSDASVVQQANEMAARGEYEAAALGYQVATGHDPDNISLRFALGSVLSHLGRQEETIEHYRWVVTHGDPGSLEVQVARRWLVSAGVLAPSVTFAVSKVLEQDAEEAQRTSAAGSPFSGSVRGRTEWRGVDPTSAPRRINLVLEGADSSNAEIALDTWVTLGEPYVFGSVDPGNYRLTARASDTILWEQKVSVEAGKETSVDLTDANSLLAAGDLAAVPQERE